MACSSTEYLFATSYIKLLTYCMEQCHSSETNRFSVSQEILRKLSNQKVYYRI